MRSLERSSACLSGEYTMSVLITALEGRRGSIGSQALKIRIEGGAEHEAAASAESACADVAKAPALAGDNQSLRVGTLLNRLNISDRTFRRASSGAPTSIPMPSRDRSERPYHRFSRQEALPMFGQPNGGTAGLRLAFERRPSNSDDRRGATKSPIARSEADRRRFSLVGK